MSVNVSSICGIMVSSRSERKGPEASSFIHDAGKTLWAIRVSFLYDLRNKNIIRI